MSPPQVKSSTQIRSLTADELDGVSGGYHLCVFVLPGGKLDTVGCTNFGTEELIDAFLDGVEKGKKKAQQKS